jgi:hypothetical protein
VAKKVEGKKEFVVSIVITEPNLNLGTSFEVKTAHLETLVKAFSIMAEVLLTKLEKLEKSKEKS